MQDNEIATYIGYKGYTIIKNYMSVEEQEFLRNDLTVKPFVPKNSLIQPQSFRVYRESKNKFYILDGSRRLVAYTMLNMNPKILLIDINK